MNKTKLFILLFSLITSFLVAQSISEINYNVSSGLPTYYDSPGTIIYPTGYSNYSSKTPVIFVHGILGKLSGAYEGNIQQVQNYHLKAAFVQLKPLGSTVENGKLLKKMIDRVRWHYNTETVSIVAHSKGGMDTERALYGQNPYVSYSLPSFGYEKVDAVYTLSSPVKGARVADLGATLSYFSGVTWATMWYTNGWSLTSGNVNSFHNWARGWRINSNGTFKNYYNQNGNSYSRINLSEDNTTRWWAHQSDDECYQTYAGSNVAEWAYCYIGRPFHHSVGAYLDAYWEWDWFNSGWRNWHSNSDGFISEYRAKRSVISNATPRFTPGAGDANYRTSRNANHTSLWEASENHFTREVAPYLHNGFYNAQGRNSNKANNNDSKLAKDDVASEVSSILASNGNVYFGEKGQTDFIVEEDNNTIEFIIYSENKLNQITLVNKETKQTEIIDITGYKDDDFSGAIVSVANISKLKKGNYTLKLSENQFLVIANNKETSTVFALNLNFDEEKGYDGESIELGIANKDNAIDFNNVTLTATLSKVAVDENTPLKIDKIKAINYPFSATSKGGIFKTSFENLEPGSVYSLRVTAMSTKGEVLLSRNIIHTFYVKKHIDEKQTAVLIDKSDKTKSSFINVYPNPSSDMVSVKNTAVINKISIINDSGAVLYNFEVNTTEYSFSSKKLNLKQGLYILKIETNKETIFKKMAIE